MADRITDALRGAPAQFAQVPQIPNTMADSVSQSGYKQPDEGPFECENCMNFQPPNQCSDPRVQADPQVQGQVDPQGVCNFFSSAHNETQEEEHTEGAPEGAEEENENG